MRNAVKAFLGLLFVFAIIYFFVVTFYPQGQNSVTPSPSTDIQHTGFIVELPQRVYVNSKVTVSAEAAAGTSCELSYITPAGNLSEATGLGRTTADTRGLCSWSWNVDGSGQAGAGRIIVTINGVSETHFIEVRSGE